jgi:hypothetical protein
MVRNTGKRKYYDIYSALDLRGFIEMDIIYT